MMTTFRLSTLANTVFHKLKYSKTRLERSATDSNRSTTEIAVTRHPSEATYGHGNCDLLYPSDKLALTPPVSRLQCLFRLGYREPLGDQAG